MSRTLGKNHPAWGGVPAREGGRECTSAGGGAGLGGREQPVSNTVRDSPARDILGDWPAPRGWEFRTQDSPMKEAQL